MENNETAKPQQGAWDDLQPAGDKKPKVEFELKKPVEVMFKLDFTKPREFPSQTSGVFYIFDCMHEGEDKVIMTSAWSLLQGLKTFMPLKGKTIQIVKVMKDGKQNYEVEDVTNPDVPVEKVGDTEESEDDDEDNEDDEVEDLDEEDD